MENEDSGILKELITGLRSQLNERMVSPLLPSFTISWLIVNYKLLVTIFSEGSYETKLTFIDEKLYASREFILWHCALIPLISALIYILIYPYPAKWFYQYALRRQRDFRKVRQEAENERVLTKEESQRLYSYAYDREQRMDQELQKRQDENNTLRSKIAELEKASSQHLNAESIPQAPDKNILENNISVDHVNVLKMLSDFENQDASRPEAKELALPLNMQITNLKILLNDLINFKYVTETYTGRGAVYSLTNEGRKTLKEFIKKINEIQSSDK